MWPTVSGLVTGGAVVALGVPFWTSGVCFALCGFVFGTVAQEFIRGAGVRRSTTGADLLTAMVGLVGRNKRRYGGYIVHLGIVLIFLGFAGEGMSRDEQLLLKPGEQAVVGRYTLQLEAIRVTDDGQKQMVTGHIAVKDENGQSLGTMYPAKWYYRKHEDQPTTEVAIRRTVAEDLYIVMPGFEMQEQTASVEVHVNPLVNWIWAGFGILAIGTGIALLPETAFSFAAAKIPAGAVTTSLVMLALLLSPALALAQKTVQPVERSALRRDLEDNIMCMCGCHQPMGSCQMRPNCGHYDEQSAKIVKLMAEGKGRDEVLASFVAEFGGQHVLAAPIDRGFNRLAWAVPYAVGLGGLFMAGLVAIRWSRRSHAAPAAPVATDAALQSRLDDELRDLD
jgi:cytochrome c-type biogenesis protein CcmF